MRRSRARLVPAFAFLFASLLVSARAQSYGPYLEFLTIGAAEFRPVDASIGSDGYLYFDGACCSLAPLNLPEGARIEEVCLYAFDGDDPGFVQVDLFAVMLAPGGQTPRLLLLDPYAQSDGSLGYTDICRSPFDTTIRGRLDVDGDGNLDAVAYYVSAFGSPSSGANGLGGVRIAWRRQVSAPPDTPTFADVPTTDVAFDYVEALAASGITAGCADGTTYCPDATLTRRQMAVFLARALGLHWSD